VAWLSSGGKGLFTAELVPGERPEVDHLINKVEVAQLEVVQTEEGPMAVYTSEQAGEMSAVACYGMLLPFGKPFPILEDENQDVERVFPFMTETGLLVACQTMDDKVVLVKVNGQKAKKWGVFP